MANKMRLSDSERQLLLEAIGEYGKPLTKLPKLDKEQKRLMQRLEMLTLKLLYDKN
jgi:hypothetical protein